ncbi:unnamed protein product [Protopolystoma xenopodis]|uniref:Secreted protein n=1 Tax=Protopolystoma xenopodis TaxID=117903 RepID=A0A3S5C794_9PLAT|nr:unnamed protein product [Protopolystoma xenopodis]
MKICPVGFLSFRLFAALLHFEPGVHAERLKVSSSDVPTNRTLTTDFGRLLDTTTGGTLFSRPVSLARPGGRTTGWRTGSQTHMNFCPNWHTSNPPSR